MEKITIQYFLNKDLTPQISGKIKKYPLYVQVIALRKNLRFKSNNVIFEYLSEEELNHPIMDKLLSREKNVIYNIVRELIETGKKDLVTSKNLGLYSKRLWDVVEYSFCKLLKREGKEFKVFVPSIFLSATYSDINEIICFYNDDYPISKISKKVSDCLQACHLLYPDKIEDIDKYSVFDLYYGIKKEILITEFERFDPDMTKDMIISLQDLATL